MVTINIHVYIYIYIKFLNPLIFNYEKAHFLRVLLEISL